MSLALAVGNYLTSAANNLPVPALVSDGQDLATWKSGASGPLHAIVYIYGPAATLTDVWVWGYRHGRWHRMARLNNGSDIPIVSATQGYMEPISLASVPERMAVQAATGGASHFYEFESAEVFV